LPSLGTGGALGGPARPGGNFGGDPANLGAAPHDWGFAKKTQKKIDQKELKRPEVVDGGLKKGYF